MALKKQHIAVLILLAAVGAALLSHAGSKKEREFEIKKKKDRKTLLVSFTYADIFNKESKKKLSSGLPTVVLMRLYLHKEGKKKKPVSMTLRKCKIIYDVWEEHYIVTISTAGSEKTQKIESRDKVVKTCSSVKSLLYPVKDVEEGTYRFAAVIDLNPVSKEVLEAMRNWLKRPLADSGYLNPADSFFGSFITIFVNEKIEPSEKTIKFKSQKFMIDF